jgi:branched-chain amino acid aminotransferase
MSNVTGSAFRLQGAPPSRVPEAERQSMLRDPGFGRYFTDHMAVAEWEAGTGWQNHRLTALAPFSLHPAAAVLHYAQEIFEGLKAYRRADDSIWLFRPRANARRFVHSAQRLALPVLDEDAFVASVEAVVLADQEWVPEYESGNSLYLRPFMFAAEAFLGVRGARTVTYAVIATPAGSYFAPDAADGVKLWVSTTYARAARGGTGSAKCGGNYASGLAAQLEARENDCDQVLYLTPSEPRLIEEVGTMNILAVTSDRELLTPELGSILAGITRDTVLDLAAEHGLKAVERPIGLDELITRCGEGSITEVFSSGTAAVITPVSEMHGKDFSVTVGNGHRGPVADRLCQHILDVQFGRRPDSHGWMHRVL